MSFRLKMGLLLLVHFAAGLVLCRPGPLFLLFAVLIYAQTTLVGAWGALGTTEPWSRTLAVLVAMAYLSLLVAVFVGSVGGAPWSMVWLGTFVYCSFPSAVIFIALRVVKHWQGFSVVQGAASSASSAGLQFTTRHLFVVTSAVAAILAVARVFRGFAPSDGIGFFLAAEVVVFGLVLTEMAILWATLFPGPPAIRLGIVLPLTLLVALIHGLYFDKRLDWSSVVAWPVLYGLQAAITAGSLLVVRSCGWRIVRARRAERFQGRSGGRLMAEQLF